MPICPAARTEWPRQCVSGLLCQEFVHVETARGSDCSRIFGPSMERCVLRATMEVARGDANRAHGPIGHAFCGVSPRRSDRCAIHVLGSPPGMSFS